MPGEPATSWRHESRMKACLQEAVGLVWQARPTVPSQWEILGEEREKADGVGSRAGVEGRTYSPVLN